MPFEIIKKKLFHPELYTDNQTNSIMEKVGTIIADYMLQEMWDPKKAASSHLRSHNGAYIRKNTLSDITQTSLGLVILDFEFVCDEPVRHTLRYNRFGTQYILAGTFGTQYILAVMFGTQYILTGMYVTCFIRMAHIIF